MQDADSCASRRERLGLEGGSNKRLTILSDI